jgi:WD40 repeat protein
VVHDLAFLPDGRGLLSGSEDGSLRVWDVERGQCVRVIQGYVLTLYDVAWSPDSSRLASAGSDTLVTMWESDGAIVIWDLASGEHLRTLRRDRPTSASISRASGGSPKHNRRRCARWERSRERLLTSKARKQLRAFAPNVIC